MTADVASRLPPPGDDETLYVLDISGYVFRAYHALPELTNAAGEPTHAVLGVTSMLLKLIDERQPRMLAVAMDSRTRSFRKEIYDDYKANRPPAPPDLKQQMLRVREIVEAYAFPVFQQDGMEADDLIASAVRAARGIGLKVVVVSADKDLLQLVDDDVWMYDSGRDAVYGAPETVKKLGVPPASVRDYLALVGDTSDNVPGVPSVGPKTAVQLLTDFGDLDGVYAHLDEVSKKGVRQKLGDHKEQAYLSQRLVTLKDDLEVQVDRDELRVAGGDIAHLRELFTELNFTRLLAQLPVREGDPSAAAVAAAPAVRVEGRTVVDDAGLEALARDLSAADRWSVFTVRDLGPAVTAPVVGLTFAWGDGQAAYVPVGHGYLGCPAQPDVGRVGETLGPLLGDKQRNKVCADSKRERLALGVLGLGLEGVEFDVMLASYLLDPERHAHTLKDVARFSIDHDLSAADLVSPGKVTSKTRPPAEIEVEVASEAACELAQVALLCAEALKPRLREAECESLLTDVEIPLARVLAHIERTGVLVDAAHLSAMAQRVAEQLIELEARCKELAGKDFNVGSPRQLEAILFDELGLPVIKRTKTARSTDQSVLEELAVHHELPLAILEHRQLAKLKSTYLDALPREINPKTGRIHTDFRQAVAATGRLSSSDPNLQNIPIRSDVGRAIREAFIPRPGWELLSVDYSQIELRVLAHLSHDKELVEAYRTASDVHVRTAQALFQVKPEEVTRTQRGQAKTVNFAVIYGQTQFALARNLRIERGQAGEYIKAFFKQYAGVKDYMDQVVEDARQSGGTRTMLGRMRKLPDLNSANRVKRQAAERVARNTPIQGTAADIIKLAMIRIHEQMGAARLEAQMLLTVHDELVFEAPAEEKERLETLVRTCMESVLDLDVPLVVDAGWGANWGQAH